MGHVKLESNFIANSFRLFIAKRCCCIVLSWGFWILDRRHLKKFKKNGCLDIVLQEILLHSDALQSSGYFWQKSKHDIFYANRNSCFTSFSPCLKKSNVDFDSGTFFVISGAIRSKKCDSSTKTPKDGQKYKNFSQK